MSVSKDDGVIAVLVERFTEQRLPRLLKLKEKIDGGEKLSETDIGFLQEVFEGSKDAMSMADKRPEFQDVVAKAVRLYHEITEQALKNEQGS